MAAAKTPRTFICQACRFRLLPLTVQARRTFTTTPSTSASGPLGALGDLSNQIANSTAYNNRGPRPTQSSFGGFKSVTDALDSPLGSFITGNPINSLDAETETPYRLHVYATKHNTHITFVQPARPASQTASSSVSATTSSAQQQNKTIDVLLSLSAGNLGFKKAGRGSYDAAYQLAAFSLKSMKEKGMLQGCRSVEVVLRGFGAGREAVTKVLMGAEGREIRGMITRVVDATRLKQGGPRAPKPRRLG